MPLRRKTGAMKRSVFVAAAAACLVPLRLRAQTAAPPGRLAAIRAAGVLRAGATGDYKPFTFRAPDGTWSGFDIDSATTLAHALGVQRRLVKTTWPTLTADLLAGAFDLAIGGVSVSPERSRIRISGVMSVILSLSKDGHTRRMPAPATIAATRAT